MYGEFNSATNAKQTLVERDTDISIPTIFLRDKYAHYVLIIDVVCIRLRPDLVL